MKGRGDVIGGYRLVSEPTSNGGGNCMWAFAEKDERHYFIKRFLDPKRPKEGSTGSVASKKLRLRECEEFEERHKSIMERLSHDVSGGGNLVLAVDFFHEGSTYYKVTERIETSSLDHPERLNARQKVVLLRTLALSVRLLHQIDVVHGDLKPDNVLVQKKPDSPFYVAKLIDFDDSYISGKPPAPDAIGGDAVFGAPEWRNYMDEDTEVQPEHLTTAADMFALGLMIHYFLTGVMPGHDPRFQFPADAVNADSPLRIDERLGTVMAGVVRAMTSRAPEARPKVDALLEALKDGDVCALGSPAKPEPVPADAGPGKADSRLKVNLNGKSPAAPVRPVHAETGGRSPSRVRINLSDHHR